MIRIPVLAAIFALAVPLAAAQQKKAAAPKKTANTADLLTFPVVEKTLPNGLKVIVVPTGFPNIVSLQIPVQTGSRNEVEPGKSGFAHFFEHMMFRGTKALSARRVQRHHHQGRRAAERLHDRRLHELPHHVREGRPREDPGDRGRPLPEPLVLDEALQDRGARGAGRVQQELREPDPQDCSRCMRDNAYTTHTYKHTTMGFIEDIEDMPNQYEYSQDVLRALVPAARTRR